MPIITSTVTSILEELKVGALACLESHGPQDFCESYDCRTVVLLLEQITQLRDTITEIQKLIEDIPSGVDYDADPENASPEDATAHTAGLIWKACQEA